MERKVLFNYLENYWALESDMLEQRKEEGLSDLVEAEKELLESNLSAFTRDFVLGMLNDKKHSIENYDIDSDDIHDLVWEYFVEDLSYWFTEKWFKQPIKVSGTLGLWNGRVEIAPKYYNDLMEAISGLVKEYDNFTLEQEGEKFFMTLIHHDGRHVLELESVEKIPEEEQ